MLKKQFIKLAAGTPPSKPRKTKKEVGWGRGKPTVGKTKVRRIRTGNKATDKLYEAVRSYVEGRGGSVLVIGGVALVDEGIGKYNYGVMVRVTGKKPMFKNV
jgi:hypothetical protein